MSLLQILSSNIHFPNRKSIRIPHVKECILVLCKYKGMVTHLECTEMALFGESVVIAKLTTINAP